MEIEFNRRTFLAVLGASIAALATKQGQHTSQSKSYLPEGICFLAASRLEPTARPRTSAITYLHS